MSHIHIVDYKERFNSAGESFFALILESELELIQSSETGRHYATARRASITSTFTEERCKQLVGKQIPGSIKKIQCEEYDFTLPETGEMIRLSHRYEYIPENKLEDDVFERKQSVNQSIPA